MKTYRFVFAVLALVAFTIPAFAATVTNVPAGPLEPLPQTKSDFWTLAISGVTPLIMAAIYKWMPKVPKLLIPVATPFVGMGLGLAMNYLAKANLSWVDMAQAGALAVFIREVVNQAAKLALVQTMLGNTTPPATPPAPPAAPPTT